MAVLAERVVSTCAAAGYGGFACDVGCVAEGFEVVAFFDVGDEVELGDDFLVLFVGSWG
jgi:hypothetical protein